jgi:hypothetical protein
MEDGAGVALLRDTDFNRFGPCAAFKKYWRAVQGIDSGTTDA